MWQGAWRSLPCEGSKLRNFCAVKSKLRLVAGERIGLSLYRKGGVMKKALLTILEPTTVTLLIAFATGLGIAVHPVFFLAALLIAIGALSKSIVNAVNHLKHRHP